VPCITSRSGAASMVGKRVVIVDVVTGELKRLLVPMGLGSDKPPYGKVICRGDAACIVQGTK